MIVKEKRIPIKVLKLEALLRRLPFNHPKRHEIEDELAKSKAGYNGEQSLQFYLDYLSRNEYHIFHDLRLFDGVHYFQIDILVVSSKLALILEVKNMKGTLYFDSSFNQLIRSYNGKEEGFKDPILQAKSHKEKLSVWLKPYKLHDMPIDYIVVVSNSNAIIKANPLNREALNKVVFSNNLVNKIKELESKLRVESVKKIELKKLSKLLLKNNKPLNPKVLEQFNIKSSDLRTGVICTECETNVMRRLSGSWYCSKCNLWSKDAHFSALKEYSLLIGSTINNKEMRNFLHLPTRSIATKLLASMNLSSSGIGKATIYDLSNIIFLHDMENGSQK